MHPPIHYRLHPKNPETHLVEVSCTVRYPDPAGQIFRLPVWIPGSYMVREFARHIVDIRAESEEGKEVSLSKLDKTTWQAAPVNGALTVIYHIFAYDLSVRTAHLDHTHGFFNGPALFLQVLHTGNPQPCQLEVLPPDAAHFQTWKLATSLPPSSIDSRGFGRYQATDYQDLIDHPLEMGTFIRLEFEVNAIPHSIIITGTHAPIHEARLCHDLKTLCTWQMELFGPPALTTPYLFMVMAVGQGYGGLEHKNSTALLCNRSDLPAPNLAEGIWPEAYVRFLGLCSHEYFHRWNVKRLRPDVFLNPDLGQECYTRLLWFFEGFTSYYDDLCLVRSGLIPESTYLELLAQTITQVQKNPGQYVQSLEDSSFDAWIKYYRPDANTPNAVVSYYAKGALVGLCLDLGLRRASKGEVSLDTLMQALWQESGAPETGVSNTEIFSQVQRLGGNKLATWLRQAVADTTDLPLEQSLQYAGVNLTWEAETAYPWLGCRFLGSSGTNTGDSCGGLEISHVLQGSPAEAAGLAPGDKLLALNHERLTQQNLETQLKRLNPGDAAALHFFRYDQLHHTKIILATPPRSVAKLTPMPGKEKARQRQCWLQAKNTA